MPDATSHDQRGLKDEEAARLRREHQGWIIIWLAAANQFRAYRRLPGTRRDTALSAATGSGLADQISRAEQAARTSPRAHRDHHS